MVQDPFLESQPNKSKIIESEPDNLRKDNTSNSDKKAKKSKLQESSSKKVSHSTKGKDPTNENSTEGNEDAQLKKKGKKIGKRQAIIGCSILGILFFLLFVVGFIVMIREPLMVANSLGTTVADVKAILMIFAAVLFVPMFLVVIGLLIVHTLRLIARRGNPNRSYVTMGVSVFVLVLLIVSAFVSVNAVDNIDPGMGQIEATAALTPLYMKFDATSPSERINYNYIPFNRTNDIIGPARISYRIEQEFLRRYFANEGVSSAAYAAPSRIYEFYCDDDDQRPTVEITGEELFSIDPQTEAITTTFTCLYDENKAYDTVLYYDRRGARRGPALYEYTFELKGLLGISSRVNDIINNNQFLGIGENPAAIEVSTDLITTAYGLQNTDLQIKFEARKEFEEVTQAAYRYETSGIYHIHVQDPLSDFVFTIPLYVESSENNMCQIISFERGSRVFSAQVPNQARYENYRVRILEKNNKLNVLDTFSNTVPTEYRIDEPGVYMFELMYEDVFGDTATCNSQDIVVSGNISIDYDFSVEYSPNEGTQNLEVQDGEIMLEQIPAAVYLAVNSPSTKVYVDDKQLFAPDDQIYKIEVGNTVTKKIRLTAGAGNNKVEEYIDLGAAPQGITVSLDVRPNKGESPLKVELDASKITPISMIDNIAFYSRDFGDGEILRDVQNSIVEHTYVYQNGNGFYKPKVTVETIDGARVTATADVVATPPEVTGKIVSTSHPRQIVSVGDEVRFQLQLDMGDVESVEWNFGDDTIQVGNGRAELVASSIYDQPGQYTVSVRVTFSGDLNPYNGSTQVIVQ